jgi:hypothetical protein
MLIFTLLLNRIIDCALIFFLVLSLHLLTCLDFSLGRATSLSARSGRTRLADRRYVLSIANNFLAASATCARCLSRCVLGGDVRGSLGVLPGALDVVESVVDGLGGTSL